MQASGREIGADASSSKPQPGGSNGPTREQSEPTEITASLKPGPSPMPAVQEGDKPKTDQEGPPATVACGLPLAADELPGAASAAGTLMETEPIIYMDDEDVEDAGAAAGALMQLLQASLPNFDQAEAGGNLRGGSGAATTTSVDASPATTTDPTPMKSQSKNRMEADSDRTVKPSMTHPGSEKVGGAAEDWEASSPC